MTNKTKRLERSEVPIDQTWDLTDLFTSDEAWETALLTLQKDISKITQYKNKLQDDAQTLLNCLTTVDQFKEQIIKVATYATLKVNADGTDPNNQSNASRVGATMAELNAALSFIEAELLHFDQEQVDRVITEEPQLKIYKKMFADLLERKPFTLSPELEEAFASLGEVHGAPYTIYQRTKSSDMSFDSIFDEDGKELPMSFALYEDRYEISPNTFVRRNATESFTNTLKQYKNTFAATYATEVNKQVTMSRLRGYDSVIDMLLQDQQVTKEMYKNQLNVIKNELAPHMRKYAKLKREQLGVDGLRFCDLQVSIDPAFNPETTYEKATSIIQDALQIMGPEYSAIMEKGIKDRWVDYADNIGKSTGAFCSSPYNVHPYILITWTDTMRGAFVLAHELGHAGHFYLAGENQALVNLRPSTYFIEAPSTLNELLLAEHLMTNTDDDRMKRWIIDQLLGTYYHNFVTHLLEAEFQDRIYALAEAGTPLTANLLCEQKKKTLENFWGDTVVIDEGASLTWMRQPHYYMGLYPYTYSAGLTVSTAVAQKIKEEGQPIIDGWLEILKAGGTEKPNDLIKQVGIDMSKPDTIQDAVAYVGSLIDQLVTSYK